LCSHALPLSNDARFDSPLRLGYNCAVPTIQSVVLSHVTLLPLTSPSEDATSSSESQGADCTSAHYEGGKSSAIFCDLKTRISAPAKIVTLQQHPLTVTEWFYFYHLRSWHRKMASVRLLLYAALGYVIAGHYHLPILCLNTLALLGLVMFQGPLNDYWDFRLSGERNFISAQVQSGRLSLQTLGQRLWFPLMLSFPMMLLSHRVGCSWTVPMLLGIGVGLPVAYSVPPLRLKTRRPWGLLVAPTLTTLMFLEAHLALAPLTPFVTQLSGLLFLFQLYAECLQVVDFSPKSSQKFAPCRALAMAHWLPGISAAIAAGLALRQPIFWLGVLGGVTRLYALRTARLPQAIARARRNSRSLLLSLYEFLGYATFGTLRLLS